LDFALRCIKKGHAVKVFMANEKNQTVNTVGDGMIEKVKDWTKWMRWADLVLLTDNTKYLHQLETYRQYGYPILGATLASAELELDREKGQQALKRCGLEIIQSKTFSDYDKAIQYVDKTRKRFVSKPSGDADKALSYCSKSPKDMIYMLQRWKKQQKLKSPFILQEFVPGIEMAVGGWFGPGGFSKWYCENYEFKKLMNDDLGVATGEQGTVVQYVNKSKLADIVLKPLEQVLHETGHTGYVDINCIIGEDGTPCPLEWTCRLGWPLSNIMQVLHEDIVDWMPDLLDGKDTFTPAEDIAVGVVMSIPDYPYSKMTNKEVSGVPIYGSKDIEYFFHPCEVKLGTAPDEVDGKIKDVQMPVTAGDYVAVITGVGDTVNEAKRMAYKNVKKIEIPNSPMYRTDIGNRLIKQLPALHAMGYSKSTQYKT